MIVLFSLLNGYFSTIAELNQKLGSGLTLRQYRRLCERAESKLKKGLKKISLSEEQILHALNLLE